MLWRKDNNLRGRLKRFPVLENGGREDRVTNKVISVNQAKNSEGSVRGFAGIVYFKFTHIAILKNTEKVCYSYPRLVISQMKETRTMQ